ncbi:MAG: MoxR family ATPase [Armatimonadetes bacterium]|nr:MoxR family ATPase [Armatimonadota bacterium]
MANGRNGLYTSLFNNLESVVRGKPLVLEHLIVSLLAGGNVLLEDVPGVGKTTLAKTLARSIGGDFKRVQFTPDLLPTDILGSSIYNPREGEFHFKKGPVFTNILLADEINRASPRTQSSLLEAMNERQVTIEGNSFQLPDPFVVLATQNPVEFHGTYPLPEAQLDRFALKLSLGYPGLQAEMEVLEGQRKAHPIDKVEPVAELSEVVEAQAAVREVQLKKPISEYILALVAETRRDPRLKLGSSTRGALALYRTSQALAYCRNRDYVLPDDIKELAVPVLAHRLVLDTKAKYSGVSKDSIVEEILEKVAVPT